MTLPAALILQRPAQTTPALVKVLSVLIPDLPTGPAPAVLPALLEARVQVGADDSLVELGAADVLHAVEGVLVGKVFDKAETAGCLVEAIQPHDQPFDLAALAEQLVDLLLGREEREVADVERRGVRQGVFGGLLGLGGRLVVAVLAAAMIAVVAATLVELAMGGWVSDSRSVYLGS